MREIELCLDALALCNLDDETKHEAQNVVSTHFHSLAKDTPAKTWWTCPDWHPAIGRALRDSLPDFITLTTRSGRIGDALTGRERTQLETSTLPAFLPLQRWFAAKDERIRSVRLEPLAFMGESFALAAMEVDLPSGTQRYVAPMSIRWVPAWA